MDRVFQKESDRYLQFDDLSSREKRERLNEIIEELIKLAHKGNRSAEEKIKEILEDIVMDWVLNNKIPAFVIDRKDKYLQLMRKAIYLHVEGKGHFLKYFYTIILNEIGDKKKGKVIYLEDFIKGDRRRGRSGGRERRIIDVIPNR